MEQSSNLRASSPWGTGVGKGREEGSEGVYKPANADQIYIFFRLSPSVWFRRLLEWVVTKQQPLYLLLIEESTKRFVEGVPLHEKV